jgi:fatty acid desaturase
MLFDAIAAPLAMLAVAVPFLFAVTESPVANFWPMVAAWVGGAALLLVGAWSALGGGRPHDAPKAARAMSTTAGPRRPG